VVGIPEDTLLQASVWMYLIHLLGFDWRAVLPSVWRWRNQALLLFFLIIGFAGLGILSKK